MHLETWNAGEADPDRAKRLAIGYAAGLLLFAGIALLAARLSGAIQPPPPEEEVVDVKLATRIPEAPPPAPAPEPAPPPPAAEAPAPRPASPRRPALVAPTAVPKEAPPEADPSEATASDNDTYGDPGGAPGGVPGGIPGGTGTATVAAAPPPPPPPPPPRGPIHLPENATPPVALACPPPVPPPAALSAGVEATVAVRFVVTEAGEVTNVSIVRGHPLFNDAVLAAMKACRYKPAISEGKPVSVWRTIPFRFKAKR